MKTILYILLIINLNLIAYETLVIQDGQQIKATNSGVSNMKDFDNSSCINSVWSYNNTNSKWEMYSPNVEYVTQVTESGSVDKLLSLAPNGGFWVVTHDGQSCDINITTVNNSSKTTIQTSSGWSLKGSKKEYLNLNSFNANTINIIWTYSPTTLKWSAYSTNPDIAQKIINNVEVETLTTLNAQDGFWIHTTDSTIIDLPNEAPVANAGINQTVSLSSSIFLTAQESLDINDNILTYFWELIVKPTGSASILSDSNATVSQPIFNADIEGDYTFKLIVNDGIENSLEDTVVITVVESGFVFHTIEGWGESNYYNNGVTQTDAILTLPVGKYNIYVEIADGDKNVKAVIGTLQDVYGTDITDTDLVNSGSLETIVNSPANITIQNDSGADKTYILPVSSKLVENNNKVVDNIHIVVVNTTSNSYDIGGELVLGDVDTNTLMMLGVDESHTWYFTAPTTGTYTLSVSTDASVNKLMQFDIKLMQNGKPEGSELVDDNSEIGSFSQENITLTEDVSYLVKINTVGMQWDTIGKYTIRLIKD